MFDFSHLWQQEQLSDVALVIAHAPDADTQVVLKRLPGHGALLSLSPFFKAMIMRWQHKRPREGSSSSPSTDAAAAQRCEVVLTLQDAEQLPAAMAVLAALYAVKPLPELLSELPQEQQLQAALLADMWQMPKISTAAVDVLLQAAREPAGLTDALVQSFLGLQAHPRSVLPLLNCVVRPCLLGGSDALKAQLTRVLLSVLGDLEEVWAAAELQDLLLALPLPAMERLLSSTELKVASEDTVLYTATAYLEHRVGKQQQRHHQQQQQDPPGATAAARRAAIARRSAQHQAEIDQLRARLKQHLAPLIRCPQLSQFWVTAAVLSADAPNMLLSVHKAELQKLMLAHQADPHSELPASVITAEIPPSWSLPPRTSRQLDDGVQVRWTVDVAEVKAAALQSAQQGKLVRLHSAVSPPIGGLTWQLTLDCCWDAEKSGILLGMYTVCINTPTRMSCCYTYEICHGDFTNSNSVRQDKGLGWGMPDFFGVGAMRFGWDDAVWSAKGMPLSGELTFTLRITAVGHVVQR